VAHVARGRATAVDRRGRLVRRAVAAQASGDAASPHCRCPGALLDDLEAALPAATEPCPQRRRRFPTRRTARPRDAGLVSSSSARGCCEPFPDAPPPHHAPGSARSTELVEGEDGAPSSSIRSSGAAACAFPTTASSTIQRLEPRVTSRRATCHSAKAGRRVTSARGGERVAS
jgi:hypothetical protein